MGTNKNKSSRREKTLNSVNDMLDMLDEVDEHIKEATSLIDIEEKRHADKIDSERRTMRVLALHCKATRDILNLIPKSFNEGTVSLYDIETSKKILTGCIMACQVHFMDQKVFMDLFGESMDEKYDVYGEISKKSSHVTGFITKHLSVEDIKEKKNDQ